MYIPLQCLTHGSPLLSQTTPSDLVKFTRSEGYPGIGLCDLDNLFMCVQYHSACRKAKIKPLLGFQLKIYGGEESSYINLYAKNLEGWKKLLFILYKSNNPLTYKGGPRLDVFELLKLIDHNIVLIIRDRFVDLFEHHQNGYDIYIGLDPVNYSEKFTELRQSKLPKVALTSSHYLKRSDWGTNKYLLANNLGFTLAKCEHPLITHNSYHVWNSEELLEVGLSQEEVDNTGRIFESVEEFEIKHAQELPDFECDDQNEYLRELCRAGYKRLGLSGQVYVDRIRMELDVISKANMAGYFIILQDIVAWARSQGILVGYGRGSSAGCLISYLIGLVNVDPIKYGLLFERFYSEERGKAGTFPDLDTDFPSLRREEVVQYVEHKYGGDRFAQLTAFNTMKGAAGLKAVLRARGLDASEQSHITKKLAVEHKIAPQLQAQKEAVGTKSLLYWCINNMAEFRQWCTPSFEGIYGEEFKAAIELDGIISGRSRHPSAFALSNEPIYNRAPLIWDSTANRYVVGVNMDDAEKLGLVKLDLLGVTLLDKADFIRKNVKNGSF